MTENEKKINEGTSLEELSLEELDDVSGGRIKVGGYVMLNALMYEYKRLGKDKDYVIQAVTNGWNQDCEYRKRCTDGTDSDLQQTIDYINKHWD